MRHRMAMAALVMSACVRSAAVPCGNDTVCAPGTTCEIEYGQCLTPDQYTSCGGAADGAPCPIGTQTGTCTDGLCLAVVCGDDRVEGIEQCDGAPPETTCFDLGYDAGFLGCNDAVCAADLPACQRVGWKADVAPGFGGVFAISSVGDLAIAARGVTTLRFRNNTWEPLPQPSNANVIVYTLFIAAEDDAWAATEDGVFRFDGTSWHLAIPSLESLDRSVVVGTGPSDVYIFANHGAVYSAFHFDGVAARSIDAPPIRVTYATTGSVGTFISDGARVHRLVGATWQQVTHPLTQVTAMLQSDGNIILAGQVGTMQVEVVIGDGITWMRYDISRELGWTGRGVVLGGRSTSELYAAEVGGTYVVRFDGVTWRRDASLPSGAVVLHAIGSRMVAGTADGMARESANTFVTVEDTLGSLSGAASAVWGRACDDVFVVATGLGTADASQIVHYDGTSWTVELDAPATTIYALAGTPGGDTYATTYDGRLLQRGQGTWGATQQQFPTPLREMSIAGDGTILLGGDDGWVHVFDGSWRSEQLFDLHVTGAFAASADELYVTNDEAVFRWSGSAWVSEPLPTPLVPQAVWGAGETVIVVGTNGRAMHRVNGTWHALTMPYDDFWSVRGTRADDVFAIGRNGTIARFDGVHWSPLRDRLERGGELWAHETCTYFTSGTTPSRVARLRRSAPW